MEENFQKNQEQIYNQVNPRVPLKLEVEKPFIIFSPRLLIPIALPPGSLSFPQRHSSLACPLRGFIKRWEAGIFPFNSGMFPLLLLINLYRVYRQIARLLCLDTRMPKKLMKPLPLQHQHSLSRRNISDDLSILYSI